MIVKVCGLREAENIRAVESAGADWTGFIFYPRSPRYVAQRPDYLPERCLRVGVFVAPEAEDVLKRQAEFGLHAVQLHGPAAPELCRRLRGAGLTVIRALPADEHIDRATRPYLDCTDYFLFDTPTPHYGGSGREFDHSLLDRYESDVPFLLSGGIGPQSLPTISRLHHPRWAGIDLNSRFETEPGRKDAGLLKTFIENFRTHESHPTTFPQ